MDATSPADDLTFTELPPVARPNLRNWKLITEMCDQRPGEWLRVGVMDQSVASQIRGGRYRAVTPEYEVTTRVESHIQYEKPTQATLFIRKVVTDLAD